MTEIVFVFLIFSQLFRIFSLRIRAGYAMRFTFKALGKTKERAKKQPDQSVPRGQHKKAPYAAGWSKYPVRMRLLLCFFSRSFRQPMGVRPSFQT